MVKGVNRQVLEIHDTETQYFEKAFLFVKPEYSNLSEKSLRESFIKAIDTAAVPQPNKSRLSAIVIASLKLLAAAAVGSLITYFILR
ncbi:MAG: hypothetical protein IJK26_03485 [Clostridia bacterium]|nr:hypothetical protein [Clostridia bacterium]HAQ63631.1 hypothetical protein [Oscillospiraceae bacterium]